MMANAGLGVFLWVRAERLSLCIAPGDPVHPPQLSSDHHAIQTMIFSGVGLILLVSALPELGYQIYLNQRIAEELSVSLKFTLEHKVNILKTGLKITVALVLILGASTLSNLLLKLRHIQPGSKG